MKESCYYDYYSQVGSIDYKYRLKIIADFTKLCVCPVCGTPDCGDEQFIWAEFDNEKLAIHFGGATFGSFLDRWYFDGITEEEYIKLPQFIKQHNECTGWADAYAKPNNIIDAQDFRDALHVIKNSIHTTENDDFSLIYCPAMKDFIDNVIREDKILNLLS